MLEMSRFDVRKRCKIIPNVFGLVMVADTQRGRIQLFSRRRLVDSKVQKILGRPAVWLPSFFLGGRKFRPEIRLDFRTFWTIKL